MFCRVPVTGLVVKITMENKKNCETITIAQDLQNAYYCQALFQTAYMILTR